MLKELQIISLATKTEYVLGCRAFHDGKVSDIRRLPTFLPGFEAEVKDKNGEVYQPQVIMSRPGTDVERYGCNCPEMRKLQACRHVVALLKALQANYAGEKIKGKNKAPAKPVMDKRFESGDKFLNLLAAGSTNAPVLSDDKQLLTLVPTLVCYRYYSTVKLFLEFRMGVDRLYVVKNVFVMLDKYSRRETTPFGKQFTFEPDKAEFKDELSQKLWDMIWRVYRHETSNSSGYNYTSSFNQKQFLMSLPICEEFFKIMEGHELEVCLLVNYERSPVEILKVVKGNPKLNFALNTENEGANLTYQSSVIVPLDAKARYLWQDDTIYICEGEFSRNIVPILNTFMGDNHSIDFHESRLPKFFGDFLPFLQNVGTVDIAKTFEQNYNLEELEAEFYLSSPDNGLEIRPSFHYGEVKFNPLTEKNPPVPGGKTLVRNGKREKLLLDFLAQYGFEANKSSFNLSDEEKCFDFLSDGLDKLHNMAEVYYSDDFMTRPVRSMPKITAGVSVNDDNLLEVTFNARDIDFNEILSVLRDYRLKKRYHRLNDGSFITLSDQDMSPLADLLENLNVKKAERDGESLRLPLTQAMYLDEVAKADNSSLSLERSRSFKSLIRNIRHPEDGELEPPPSLTSTLREYQTTGFRWLTSLAHYRLGGILADDMGLGKTLQVLSFLLSKRDASQPPSLVIAPTSLIYNWLEEAERFTPELTGAAVNGTRGEREKILAGIGDENHPDFLVTTYNLLRRDLDLYENKEFYYCFLDEAQHIKNPDTKAAKAVKSLKAQGYFALTGTPFENTLTELWSIFDFLLPGYLHNHAKFKQRYENPIVKEEDGKALNDLRHHIMPFVMRRLKKDVLKELPDKVESRRLAEMTAEQTKIYKAYFVQSQKEFADALAEAGIAQSKIKILALLTRLRQIACDPSMFLEDYHGGSGKLEMLEEVAADAVAGGHRMLVFSQFTTMLKNIRACLTDKGIECFYLDGQTPSKDRLRLVKDFNEGNTPVFLISLKAGGTGLNLTGADMVIHFDPWWNPAVEDQATDRAYRIGQEKNVQVLKFISKGTIEERIYKLQEKKRDLFDQMIKPGESFLSGLTDDEIKSLFV